MEARIIASAALEQARVASEKERVASEKERLRLGTGRRARRAATKKPVQRKRIKRAPARAK